MMKNQRKLEEEAAVTMKIIQAKDQEIKGLKELVYNKTDLADVEQKDELKKENSELSEISPLPPLVQNLGLFLTSPREAFSRNMSMLKVYLAGEDEGKREEEISWSDVAINTSAKIIGCFLSKIF